MEKGYLEKMKNLESVKFKNLIKNLFERNGFYITELHYEHIVPKAQFRDILNKEFQKSEVTKIVRFSPDFFVIHDEIDPAMGTFFIVCSLQSGSLVLERDKLNCYLEHYPCERIAIVSLGESKAKDKNIVFCEWLNKFKYDYSDSTAKLYIKKFRTLTEFLESELHINHTDKESK